MNELRTLIRLVKERPEIYNNTSDDVHRGLLWNEIGVEMNKNAFECKSKWMALRGNYRRHLRNMKNNETICKFDKRWKKPWYLASEMDFIQEFTHLRSDEDTPRKSTNSNLSMDESTSTTFSNFEPKVENCPLKDDEDSIVSIESSAESNVTIDDAGEPYIEPSAIENCPLDVKFEKRNFAMVNQLQNENEENIVAVIDLEDSEPEDSEISTSNWVQAARENLKMTASNRMDEVDSTMRTLNQIEVHSDDSNRSATKRKETARLDSSSGPTKIAKKVDEDTTVTFFESILPDISKLSERGLRLFKQEILTSLNQSLDDQEHEEH